MIVEKKLNTEKLERDLKDLRDKGIKSIAVALMHSYWLVTYSIDINQRYAVYVYLSRIVYKV